MAVPRRILLIAAFVLAFGFAWLVLTGPAPKPADAPADQFSAGRAMADVTAIAARPHPVGSAEDAAALEHLLRRMTDLGLSPRVQETVQVSDKTHLPVTVSTVVGVLPGGDPAAASVAVMAHYDSTPKGPGAADDAGGAAAVLEIARAMKAAGVPQRDVVLVITDGEEAGMLGAKAFFAGEAQARRVGFVVNLEARGSRGRAMMFETGAGNAETIRLFSRTAKRPLSNSLMVMVYELMPNFTDFTEAKKVGLAGLNFAFLGGPGDYHAASDTPANFDQRSLQDIGDQALAATRAAAAGLTPKATANLVYSDVLNLGILAYPPWVGWLVVAGAAGLLGAGAAQTGGLTARDLVLGAAISLASLVLAGAAFYGAQAVMGALRIAPDTHALAVETAGWIGGLALFLAWMVVTRRLLGRRSAASAWVGMLLSGLVLVAVVQALAPAAAPIIAWPVAVACVIAAATGLGRRWPWLSALLATPALAYVTCLAHLAFLSLLTPLAMTPWPWMAALLLAPLALRPSAYLARDV
ncbi:MAG: peptidase family [Caulobacteraceae bacterium]|nr:peptidase family [Caulobacteraceae bacterium]